MKAAVLHAYDETLSSDTFVHYEDVPDPRWADRDVVVALQIHRDLLGSEVVVLAQVDDLAHHVDMGGIRADLGSLRARSQTLITELFVTLLPGVEGLARNPVIAAGHRHVAGDFLGVVEDREAPLNLALHLFFGHPISIGSEDPECQASPSVL